MPVVKSFNCPSCGAPIKDIKNPKVTCEYCGSTYCIEGLDSCLNVVKKENIKSGINFEPCADTLHKSIVDFLTSDVCAPLDILDSTYISLKENLCVPAYYYHYNGTSDYLCDVGNENIKHLSGGNGEIKKVSEISWSTISGNIRAEAQRIVSGNSDYDSIINEFYKPYQEDDNIAYKENKLVDIESFSIPSNIKSVPFSRPASDLLDAYVRPDMNDAFKKSVLRQIGNRASRNISFGSSNIEKDGAIDRLLISIYHITFTYGENTFSLYASGDGKKIKLEGIPPIDDNRKKELETLNQEYESIDGSVSFFTLGVIALIVIITIFVVAKLFIGGSSNKKEEETTTQAQTTTAASKEDASKKVSVPSVIGKTEEEAKTTLNSLGLGYKATYQPSNTIPEGTVISQGTSSGTKVAKNTTITLSISSGPESSSVTNVVGQDQVGASSLLESAGFKVSVKQSYSDSVEQGKVISQSPSGSTTVSPGSTVTITVSQGKETKMVTVPNVVGMNSTDAQNTLTSLGLNYSIVETKDTNVEKGKVISTSPSAGQQVEEGTSVKIYVSKGQETTTAASGNGAGNNNSGSGNNTGNNSQQRAAGSN